MALPWTALRTDTFTITNTNYTTGYAPSGYVNIGSSDVGIKDNTLNLRNVYSPQLRTSGIASNAQGGKIRAKINSVSGPTNAPPYGFTVEAANLGAVAALYTAVKADGSAYYRGLAYYQDSAEGELTAPSMYLAIQSYGASDNRTIADTVIPGTVTSLIGKHLEHGFIVLSSTEHIVFVRLYDTDNTTLLGELVHLHTADRPNSPAVQDIATNVHFGVGNSWGSVDDVVTSEYSFTGALQTPEAYVLSVSQGGTVNLYGTPGQGGTAPYSYQWQKNTNISSPSWSNVSGATSLRLRETGVSVPTQYRLRVTDSAGSPATETSNVVLCTPSTSICLMMTGDSLTAGNGEGAYPSYNAALDKKFADNSKTLYRMNVAAGATTSTYQTDTALKARYTAWITTLDPDAFLIRPGTNDAGASVTPSTFEANLRAGTQAVTLAANCLLLYLNSPWTNIATRQSGLESYDSKFVLLASEHPSLIKWQGTVVRAATNGQTNWYTERLSDPSNLLHPNRTGYAAIADLDYEMIIDNLVNITSITIDQGASAIAPAGETTTFTATVVGNSTANLWSLESGSAGSVNATTGAYLAPEVGQDDKTATLKVTAADGIKTDSIAITILGENSLRALGGGGGKRIGIRGGFYEY